MTSIKRKGKKQKEQVKQKEIKFSTASTVKISISVNSLLEFPVLCVFDRLDSPSEFVSQSFGEEFLDRNIEFLREHYCQTRINVILQSIVSVFCLNCHVFLDSQSSKCSGQPPCCHHGLRLESPRP